MSKKSVASVLVAAGVAGSGVALMAPSGAVAQDNGIETGAEVVPEGCGRLLEQLAPVVADGTISQEQADAIAEHLAGARDGAGRGFGRPRAGIDRGRPGSAFGSFARTATLDMVADVLGLSTDTIIEALRDGDSIDVIAETQGIDAQEAIDALVTTEMARLEEAVAAGKIDRGSAADPAEPANERITDLISGELEGLRRGFGRRGNPAAAIDPDAVAHA